MNAMARCSAFFVALTLASGLTGQTTTFTVLGLEHLPLDSLGATSLALGDLNGDGTTDLMAALATPPFVRVYWNDGRGHAVETPITLPAPFAANGIALGDVDVDGDLDVVLARGWLSVGLQNSLLRNDGGGTFTDVSSTQLPLLADNTASVLLIDVDRDGDLDLYEGNSPTWMVGGLGGVTYSGGQDRLSLNNGQGFFTDATSRLPVESVATTDAAMTNLDADGDLDLAVANDGSENRIYLNDGTGTFADATNGNMPAYDDSATAVVAGDLDRDGDAELVFGNKFDRNGLYFNDGAARFTDGTSQAFPPQLPGDSVALGVGDFDGDRDPGFDRGARLLRSRTETSYCSTTVGGCSRTSPWAACHRGEREAASVLLTGTVVPAHQVAEVGAAVDSATRDHRGRPRQAVDAGVQA